jgi:hypothetical protein
MMPEHAADEHLPTAGVGMQVIAAVHLVWYEERQRNIRKLL